MKMNPVKRKVALFCILVTLGSALVAQDEYGYDLRVGKEDIRCIGGISGIFAKSRIWIWLWDGRVIMQKGWIPTSVFFKEINLLRKKVREGSCIIARSTKNTKYFEFIGVVPPAP